MDKITDLKIYKKLLSLLSAFTIMLTPISGLTEGEKESSKTNEDKVEEMIEEPEEDYEIKQMTLDYFESRKMELRKEFWPLARDYIGKRTEVDALFFISNIESCMDILDELMTENNDIKTKFALTGNYIGVGFTDYVMSRVTSSDFKGTVDLTDFIYDEVAREEVKPITDLIIELKRDIDKNKPNKEKIKTFINLFENGLSTLGNRIFMSILARQLKSSIGYYFEYDVSNKELEKYLEETNEYLKYTVRDGVVLNRDSDNIVELLAYIHIELNKYSDGIFDEMLAFDYEFLEQQKVHKK